MDFGNGYELARDRHNSYLNEAQVDRQRLHRQRHDRAARVRHHLPRKGVLIRVAAAFGLANE